LPTLGADLGDLARLEVRHAPVAGQAGDAAHEVADQLAPARRVRHLGVELHGVELALLVGDGRERRALRHAHHLEAGGSCVTRSPWLIHTVSRSPFFQKPSNSGVSAVISSSARPNSR
jgi:hypothetical protein